MKMGEKLTFVNFIKRITDGWVKIIFRQYVMGWVVGILVKCPFTFVNRIYLFLGFVVVKAMNPLSIVSRGLKL